MSLGEVFTDVDVARVYRYRAPYPDALFERLRRLVVPPRVILDAGAGSGALARRMVSFAERVDAVDPSAAMISAGRSLAGGDDLRIRWIIGRAEDVALSPPYGLITCGASLHWMDLDIVLARFRDALAPTAVLAVVDVENVHRGTYREEVLAVIKEHSEVEHHRETSDLVAELRGSGRFTVHGEDRTEPIPLEQTVGDYIDFLHSTSTLARIRLGERSAVFDESIRAIFARHGLDRVAFGVVGYLAWGRPS